MLDQHGDVAAVRLGWDVDAARERAGSVDYLTLTRSTAGWRAVDIVWEDDRSRSENQLLDETPDWVL